MFLAISLPVTTVEDDAFSPQLCFVLHWYFLQQDPNSEKIILSSWQPSQTIVPPLVNMIENYEAASADWCKVLSQPLDYNFPKCNNRHTRYLQIGMMTVSFSTKMKRPDQNPRNCVALVRWKTRLQTLWHESQW